MVAAPCGARTQEQLEWLTEEIAEPVGRACCGAPSCGDLSSGGSWQTCAVRDTLSTRKPAACQGLAVGELHRALRPCSKSTNVDALLERDRAFPGMPGRLATAEAGIGRVSYLGIGTAEGVCWRNMEPPNNELIVPVLINGAIFAALAVIVPAFLLSRFVRDIAGRAVLVIFLFAAAGAYFGFATLGREVVDARPIWTLVELLQVVVFGAMALLGLRGSPYWLAAGWALHPLWDVLLHYIGPGQAFTPWTYAIACISFDWLVAIYIAIAYRFGLVGNRRLARDNVAAVGNVQNARS
jgi:hypothetical protein